MPPASGAHNFIPFAQAGPPPGPELRMFRPKVLPGGNTAAAFKPLTPGTAPHSHHSTVTSGAQPLVTLKREGDLVTGIRIQCACGQVIELACSY